MNIFDIPKIKYIGHRGFTPMAPENSLPSFAYAGMLGQWAIETDVHVTKDGEIVCCHNTTVDNFYNGSGAIKDMTLNELTSLRIIKGNRLGCFSSEELRMPKFSEYLDICRRYGSVPFIELKTDDAERVIHALRKHGFSDDEVVMSAIEFKRIKESRLFSANMFVHWIFADEGELPTLAALGNAGFSWKIDDSLSCPKERIDLGHDMGLKVCLRAADSYEIVKHMINLGLDYLPTNTMHEKRKGAII